MVATSQTTDVKIQETLNLYSQNLVFLPIFILVFIGRALRVKWTFERLRGMVQLNKPITVKYENGCL